ncbi:MAG: outer membrane lipoprotein carrier protein LolA [Saprospiraceae bacterium]|nr:outer membrane lipoprotein carrier protein LolA [Saprospiraceae bacterium]
MRLTAILTLLFNFSFLGAQDAQALKLLKSIESKYLKSNYKLDFTMQIKEVDVKIQAAKKGSFTFSKNAYSMILPDQNIYYDGQTQWTHFVDRKEIQITNSEISESSYHPLKFIQLYKSDQFKYRIESMNSTKKTIEFVPLDKNQEYFKVKLGIENKTGLLSSIEVYLKNGNRFTISILKHTLLKAIDASIFQLNTSAIQGVHIEDLR